MRTMLRGFGPPPNLEAVGDMKKEWKGEFAVRLFRRGDDEYAVQYGKQLDWRLTYEEAATKLGEALMHQAGLGGELD